jgi:hypothetical protein
MRHLERLAVAIVWGTLTALPVVASAHEDPDDPDDHHHHNRPVGFDVQFGNPADLAAVAANHFLEPNEFTVAKGDFVTFRVNGAGHGIAIYPVSANTTREHITSQLCDGTDPTNCSPMHERQIFDGKDRLVIKIGQGGQAVPIDSDPGRLLSAGAFLTGTKPPAKPGDPNVPGNLVKVRFEEPGRYLVVCMNRAHVVNPPWMFGFVNVTGRGVD